MKKVCELNFQLIFPLKDLKFLENKLLPTCQLIEAPADMKLIEEGQAAEGFYFVYHGRVVAFQNGRNRTVLKEVIAINENQYF